MNWEVDTKIYPKSCICSRQSTRIISFSTSAFTQKSVFQILPKHLTFTSELRLKICNNLQDKTTPKEQFVNICHTESSKLYMTSTKWQINYTPI